ncbi:[FeFe]-hydrogenase maturation protein HydE [Salinispira pacifica]|uniref:[FeFe]-hydrogenase maturation protein HydE n=2 Tax=Salinispira pacifica TaxID=1307761 RepID=V5WJJ3_9SPIO|nr:[FeFe]-hydrogenase maturation protein HydE [Salinispira pacifica]
MLSRKEILEILSISRPDEMQDLSRRAGLCLEEQLGSRVYYRGLIEYSNICSRDCLYCGIRRSAGDIQRYTLAEEEILNAADFAAGKGYGSLTLQSGESASEAAVDFAASIIRKIKKRTASSLLPRGLGITLCIGEQTEASYRRLFEAGAHRYLLRIESSNPAMYRRIHPRGDSLQGRIDCLRNLKKIGFQTGTGVMIGLPGQSIEDLADDVEFFYRENVDMIGMGPFIPHSGTPLGAFGNYPAAETRLELSLKMIAAVRLAIPDVNIASTTALQALHPMGREMGLNFGANVLMPVITPGEVRKQYQLYDGKPCLDDSPEDCANCLISRVGSTGRSIAFNSWGDPLHFFADRHTHTGDEHEGAWDAERETV